MRIYIAGPISLNGDASPEAVKANLQRFHDAAAHLRDLSYAVENPADNTGCEHTTWLGWMRMGIAQLVRCDGVALLNGWTASRGATVERDLALALGLDVRLLDEWGRS